jgi:hypothetical protein
MKTERMANHSAASTRSVSPRTFQNTDRVSVAKRLLKASLAALKIIRNSCDASRVLNRRSGEIGAAHPLRKTGMKTSQLEIKPLMEFPLNKRRL